MSFTHKSNISLEKKCNIYRHKPVNIIMLHNMTHPVICSNSDNVHTLMLKL